MSAESNNLIKTFVLDNKFGLHARPSALIVKTANGFKSSVTIIKDGFESDGKSIMELVMLGATPGESLTVVTDGDDAMQAMQAIEELFLNRFGEDAWKELE